MAANTSWNRLTSFVNINIAGGGDYEFSVSSPLQNVPGAILSIHKEQDNGSLEVKLGSLALDDEFEDLTLNEGSHSVLLMWNGEKWVVLSQAIESFQGGSVGNIVTFTNIARFRNITSFRQQGPTVLANDDDAITADELDGQNLFTITPTVARSKALPSAFDGNQEILGTASANNDSVDFTIINLGSASGATLTLTAGTGITLVGSAVVDEGTSATFRWRKTGTSAAVVYRV